MTDVLKMAITCTIDCLEQRDLKQPDAIIVGTSMGCNVFTKRFLDKIISSSGGLLSPTSFILSTHNTIAGQISLLLGNHEYNMTHTQNSLSFEQALIDGLLCFNDGCNNILVGASDEMESTLYNMKERLDSPYIHLTSGASFFILSKENPGAAAINLVDVGSYGLTDNLSEVITGFLNSNNLSIGDVDLLLYSNTSQAAFDELTATFPTAKLFDYQKLSGSYFTNSAFAMSYGVDVLLEGSHPLFDKPIRRILVCNSLIPENLGLILLDSNEGII